MKKDIFKRTVLTTAFCSVISIAHSQVDSVSNVIKTDSSSIITSPDPVIETTDGGEGSKEESFTITGSFMSDAMWYMADPKIKADTLDQSQNPGNNNIVTLMVSRGNLSAGIRYEAYLPPMIGFETKLKGQGITNRFVTYSDGFVEVTAGNFYEQFGTGVALRTYQEPQLGIDNSIDGLRCKVFAKQGLTFTGLIGKNRLYFDKDLATISALNVDLDLNQAEWLLNADSKVKLAFGASVVNKFEPDYDDVLPDNSHISTGRMNFGMGDFTLFAEYAHKSSDPSLIHNGGFRQTGNAMFLNAAYSKTGLGINLAVKRTDNMSFRSNRESTSITTSFVNYLPALTKQHTYRLLTLYPYTTIAFGSPNRYYGEIGGQFDLVYKIKKGSKIGGKYGTTVTLNASIMRNLKATANTDPANPGYTSELFAMGDSLYFRDANLEISRKWSPKLKTNVMYANIVYNNIVLQGAKGAGEKGTITSHTFILETLYKITDENSVRAELQHMYVDYDRGSWAMGLVEFGLAGHWFIYAQDEWNYTLKTHYYSGGIIYIHNSTRLSLSAGRQRAGLLCVGGVCRIVPASSGVSLSLTTTF